MDGYGSIQQLHQFLRERQAHAKPFALSGGGIVDLIKTVEDSGLLIGWNSDARIFNPDFKQLLAFQEKGGNRDNSLLERLLTCALIEARSCERFRLLSIGLEDEELRQFYHKFMIAEAGHYHLFIELARKYFGRERTDKRWNEYLEKEAEILKSLELRGDRMH